MQNYNTRDGRYCPMIRYLSSIVILRARAFLRGPKDRSLHGSLGLAQPVTHLRYTPRGRPIQALLGQECSYAVGKKAKPV
jgi:hypothetical protein